MKLLVLLASFVAVVVLGNPLDDSYHPSFRDEQASSSSRNAQQEQTIEYWKENAKQTVDTLVNRKDNTNVAKNVIMFLGDGMSISTVAMARVYAGGEERQLSFEQFPYIGMSKTYCVDYQVPDSACTATAYLTGVKGNYETIGVNAQVPTTHCTATLDNSTHTYSIAKWAMDAGKDAGVVTTTRVTHASPSGNYAHIADRDWESNGYVDAKGCDSEVLDDIAEQLVHGETGKRLKVIMGGGRREFLDTDLDPEYGTQGYRTDGKNLIQEWLDLAEEGENRTYVWNKQDLFNVDPARTDKLLALFEPSHCAYNLDRVHKNMEGEPSLAEMVDRATDILSNNENGFFLFVEGGRIDHGHHDTWGRLAIDETVQFAEAIDLARKKFSEEDTLIVVTSDHSHSVSYSGYASRSSDIFGWAGTASDGLPYMTLSYANGRGYNDHIDLETKGRKDVRTMDTLEDYFRFPATLPVDSETHGGEDVAVYASGPWAHLFTGSYEQHVIPHLMAYALCVGDGLKACDESTQ
ncbi:membrane-bound alkaline phosphatase-like [Armigeres subalbatus]|uniref:membrane-bound alkaline phosphatase-like n=1 Tax=Armigeres subalbatus TaxID=124917 RepID=UPI002ED0383C